MRDGCLRSPPLPAVSSPIAPTFCGAPAFCGCFLLFPMGVRKIHAASFYGCLKISLPSLLFPRPSHRLSVAHRLFVDVLFSIQWVSEKSLVRALFMGVCRFLFLWVSADSHSQWVSADFPAGSVGDGRGVDGFSPAVSGFFPRGIRRLVAGGGTAGRVEA